MLRTCFCCLLVYFGNVEFPMSSNAKFALVHGNRTSISPVLSFLTGLFTPKLFSRMARISYHFEICPAGKMCNASPNSIVDVNALQVLRDLFVRVETKRVMPCE